MIKVNITKAKDIAHKLRRENRENEFLVLDKQVNIYITNPLKLAEIEALRQSVRDKYALIQVGIDASKTIDEIKASLNL